MQNKVSLEEFNLLLAKELPFAGIFNIEAVSLDQDAAILLARCDASGLRPGGTVSGPVMMGLADAAFYAVVLANIGPVSLAVTTSLTINFLRKPDPGDLLCKATILKLGKRLAVCQATLYTEGLGEENPVAHVTGTYSIPPLEARN